jgi:hypothetical protein
LSGDGERQLSDSSFTAETWALTTCQSDSSFTVET